MDLNPAEKTKLILLRSRNLTSVYTSLSSAMSSVHVEPPSGKIAHQSRQHDPPLTLSDGRCFHEVPGRDGDGWDGEGTPEELNVGVGAHLYWDFLVEGSAVPLPRMPSHARVMKGHPEKVPQGAHKNPKKKNVVIKLNPPLSVSFDVNNISFVVTTKMKANKTTNKSCLEP